MSWGPAHPSASTAPMPSGGGPPALHRTSTQERWVSKASAQQRMGRAGRTGPGHCFRLYSQAEFHHFDDFTAAEIKRLPLEHLLLQIKAMRLGDIWTFPFLERPSDQVHLRPAF